MAYNNSIALATSYLPILDEVYKANSKTAILDATSERVQFIGANSVKLFKISTDGLGDYSRNAGFVTGAVTGTWETMTLANDRGRSFLVDVMDNDETMGMAFGSLVGEFVRTKVVPEVDAYTFAKLAGWSGISSANADITVGTTDVSALISVGEQVMGDEEVPEEGRILFVSETCYAGLKNKITRMVMNGDNNVNYNVEMFDDMRVIKVPKGRFNTAITQYDGTSAGETDGGYIVPASTSYPINFMIVHPSAVAKVIKHVVPRVFSPQENQMADAWKFDYRLYYDVFVEDNKKAGIYMHRAATANS